MKKKLYKAKKNWVIGLIAGTMLIVSGVNIHDVYADTQPTYNAVKVENDYTNTQLAITASSGLSIPQNNTIRQDYSDLRNFSTPMKTVEDTNGIQKYLTYNPPIFKICLSTSLKFYYNTIKIFQGGFLCDHELQFQQTL